MKAKVVERYRTCVICDGTHDLDIHCRNVERVRRADVEKDLTLMCQSCLYKYARNVIKESKQTRTQKKKVQEKRGQKIKQADEFLWQQMQKRFNEIKLLDKEAHRRKSIQTHQPYMKKEHFVEAMQEPKNKDDR